MERIREAAMQKLVGQFRNAVNSTDWERALTLAKRIIPLEPRNRDVWESMAAIFLDANCIDEAKKAVYFLEKHFQIHPSLIMLKTQLAYLTDDWNTAIALGESGLSSGMSDSHKALLYNCLAQIYVEINEVEKAAIYQRKASFLSNNISALLSYSNYLFYMHYCEYTQKEFVEAAKFYNLAVSNIMPYTHGQHKVHNKIRVGYLSADFYASVTSVFCYPFFKAYDRRRFSIYVYAKCDEDKVSRDLAQYVDVWRNVTALDIKETAELIYGDGIDILFDPSGHNQNNCLPIFAYKPAPVQISGLGYFDTTGLSTMDYFLTDVYVDPIGKNDIYFVEKLLRLPRSHFCYTSLSKSFSKEIAPCLRKGYITFGTLNKFAKVTDKMLSVWSEILHRVPQACLYLKGSAFDHRLSRNLACKRLQAAGIPLCRVTLSGFDDNYMQSYNEIDIALDTYPYPGGTTTCDALYFGVPVVTLIGESHNRRFGYSLLKNMQMDELIAYNADDYVNIAVSLARNRNYLVYLRKVIACKWRTSPMMNMGAYMADVESAYYRILERNNKNKLIEEDIVYWFSQGEIGAQRLCYLIMQELEGATGLWRLKLLCYLADAAKELGDLPLKYSSFLQAVELWELLPNSDKSQLNPNWGYNLQAGMGKSALELGFYKEAVFAYDRQVQIATSHRDKLEALSSKIMTTHFMDNSDDILVESQNTYREEINKIVALSMDSLPRNKREKKIRIGYMSPDFRNHALFPCIYGLFAASNKKDFVVIGYQLSEQVDAFTENLQSYATKWRDVSKLTYRQVAEQIREDGIDILVDLAGHSANSGLPVFGYRPSKVQISGLGSLCITGIEQTDYFITDKIVNPEKNWFENSVGEKPLYLPSHFSYAGRNDLPESLGAPCLTNGFVQFAIFQRYSKINNEMLLAWKKILFSVPNSRLIIKNLEFASDAVMLMAYEKWQAAGMPMDRIDLEPGDSNYMERMLNIDIILDTYPYTGGRTTMDALYMGVPVITRYGKRRNTRFGLSILTNIGLEELAVADMNEYVQRAVGLAKDVELLDMMHKNLRGMMMKSNLMPGRYMSCLENAYRQIMNRY